MTAPDKLVRHAGEEPPLAYRRAVRFVANGAETGGAYSLTEQTLPPDFGPFLHVHHAADEANFVLEGEVTFQIEDDIQVGAPGTFVLIPRGTRHTHGNRSQSAVRLLVLYSPPAMDEEYWRRSHALWRSAASGGSPPSREAIKALAREYDLEIVGPSLTTPPIPG